MKKLLIFPVVLLCIANLFSQTHNGDLKKADELNRKALQLFSQQKFKEALEPARESCALYEKAAGKYDLQTARVLTNIAQIYLKLDKRKDAKNAFEDALDVYEKNDPLTADHQGKYVGLLETVGLLEAGDDEVGKGESNLERAIAIREKLNGPDSEELAATLYGLARVYLMSGKYEEALPVMMRSIDIRTGDDGKVHGAPSVMEMSADCLLSKLGKEDERKTLKQRFADRNVVEPAGPRTPEEVKLIQGGVVNGKALSLPAPRYSATARSKGVRGMVKVNVLINEAGKVIFACAVEGPRELHYSSEMAAYASMFSPTTLKGHPVKVSGVLKYNYLP